jgi:undecaprenyl-diphosphatase
LPKPLLLGLLEGLTEFIPVSSTGHLILIGHFLGFHSTGKTFEVLIQLGAILAIMLVYFTRLLGVVLCLPTDAWARRFVVSVLVAFLPAAMHGRARCTAFIKRPCSSAGCSICVDAHPRRHRAPGGRPPEAGAEATDNVFRFSPAAGLKIGIFSSAPPSSPACRARAPPSSAPC